VCAEAAAGVIDRVVEEAASAANLLGLGGDAARRYGDAIMATMPLANDAICETEPVARARKIEALSRAVRGVSDGHRIPMIIERGLTSIAVRLARQAVRRGAAKTRFSADELENEFITFAEQLEGALFKR